MTIMNRRQMIKIGVAASSIGTCMGVKPCAAEALLRLSLPLDASLSSVGAHTGVFAQKGGNSCLLYEYDELVDTDPCSQTFFDIEETLYGEGQAWEDWTIFNDCGGTS
jgi:hypothetical protein